MINQDNEKCFNQLAQEKRSILENSLCINLNDIQQTKVQLNQQLESFVGAYLEMKKLKSTMSVYPDFLLKHSIYATSAR